MNPGRWLLLAASAVLLQLPLVSAGAESQSDKERPQTDNEVERIHQSLALLLPDSPYSSIEPTPIPGLYEVVFGGRITYVSADGRYLIQGDLFDLETQQSLTQPRLNQVTLAAVESLGDDAMVIYPAEKEQHRVTVFTDIDSAFSRKMHRERAEYNRQGITLRYLFFPRAGAGSPSHRKAVTAWCATDRLAALDEAMDGKVFEEDLHCSNPLDRHMALGRQLGVSGVPALLLGNGEMLPGYLSAERLNEVLQRIKTSPAK